LKCQSGISSSVFEPVAICDRIIGKIVMGNQIEDITPAIRTIREQKVILDTDLAQVFGVPTFRFNEAVKRNRERFPGDFMFQLTRAEHEALISQIAMSKVGRGGRRTPPYAFTEHGAIMAANVLNSPDAVRLNSSPITNFWSDLVGLGWIRGIILILVLIVILIFWFDSP
jgi:hypothetical protein